MVSGFPGNVCGSWQLRQRGEVAREPVGVLCDLLENGAERKGKPQPVVCNKAEDEIGLNLTFKFHSWVSYLGEKVKKKKQIKSEQIRYFLPFLVY